MAEVADKPEGFSEKDREEWWNLVRQCTQQNPTDRPIMSSVVSKLGDIYKSIQGIKLNTICFFEFMQTYLTDFKCKKHGKLAHQVFISYRMATDTDIFFFFFVLSTISLFTFFLTIITLCQSSIR